VHEASHPRLSPFEIFPVRAPLIGIVTLLFLTGCATALKRESQCLASMTPEIVQAKEELENLEASWHESLGRRDVLFSTGLMPFSTSALSPSQPRSGLVGAVYATFAVRASESPKQEEARLAARRAYERLAEAKVRYQPFLGMYDKVYQRVRTRTDEEEILSEVRMVLLAGPASLVLYPIIRWNVRSVLWDGADPDADTDPVTRFCAGRLVKGAMASQEAHAPPRSGLTDG